MIKKFHRYINIKLRSTKSNLKIKMYHPGEMWLECMFQGMQSWGFDSQ